MNALRPHPRQLIPVTLLLLALAVPFAALAQTAPTTPATAKPAAAKEETITLTAFEVTADASDTYDATNTNAITGTNTPLGKTPLDAKVFNRQLMDEMGVVDMTQMLSQFGGLGAAIISGGNEEVRGDLEGDRQDPKSMTMRGLQINNPRRDGFLRSDTSLMDSFDTERVEAIGGSNSLLFGSGDAGGVITSSSKRALIGRPLRATLSVGGDSEGSRRVTFDAGVGAKHWAFRVNAVDGDSKYFRPANRQENRGLQLAATIRPWKRLEIRGEWRHLTRVTTYPNSGTVRAPLTLLLPAGERVDGQSTRYLAAFPNVGALTGGVIDVTKADTLFGPYYAFAFKNMIKSVVAEATLAEGLGLQVRYGHDARVNNALSPTNNTIFAPGSTGNLYADPATGQVGTQWAFTSGLPQLNPFHTGARGYRAAVVYQKDLGRWLGRHQASAFLQDMQSWTNQEQWRYFEADSSGKVIQNPALIQATDSGRINIPAIWLPINTTKIIGGQSWPFSSLVHPNGNEQSGLDRFNEYLDQGIIARPLEPMLAAPP